MSLSVFNRNIWNTSIDGHVSDVYNKIDAISLELVGRYFSFGRWSRLHCKTDGQTGAHREHGRHQLRDGLEVRSSRINHQFFYLIAFPFQPFLPD